MRLIDADSFMAFGAELPIKAGMRYAKTASFFFNKGCETVLEAIDSAPTIGPESLRPVEHWKESDFKSSKDGKFIVCTGCRHAFLRKYLWCRNYCPNCGARMEDTTND